jgi:hypothetical protein
MTYETIHPRYVSFDLYLCAGFALLLAASQVDQIEFPYSDHTGCVQRRLLALDSNHKNRVRPRTLPIHQGGTTNQNFKFGFQSNNRPFYPILRCLLPMDM